MQPQTIVDRPVPLLDGSISQSTGNNTNPVVADGSGVVPSTNVDVAFPPVFIAQEAITQSLNTATKTILAQYTFESLGALLIGLFQQGVSGEIKISPNGIVAKNSNGDITFTLDGTTGNATFLGTVAAGSVIAATISADKITAGTFAAAIGIGNGNVLIDGANKRILINDGSNDRILIGFQSGGF